MDFIEFNRRLKSEFFGALFLGINELFLSGKKNAKKSPDQNIAFRSGCFESVSYEFLQKRVLTICRGSAISLCRMPGCFQFLLGPTKEIRAELSRLVTPLAEPLSQAHYGI